MPRVQPSWKSSNVQSPRLQRPNICYWRTLMNAIEQGPDWQLSDLISSDFWGRRIKPAGANFPRLLPNDFKQRGCSVRAQPRMPPPSEQLLRRQPVPARNRAYPA
jgi:hypothetical protein